MSTKQKLTDLVNDGINRLDEDDADELLKVLKENTWLREALEPERLARQFHVLYELNAPEFGYETRKETAVPWDSLPDNNKSLMLAVCREIESAALAAEGEEEDGS